MMWYVRHPGIQNEYWTSGATEDAAWEKMRTHLEQIHGGLASGMLGNCYAFEDQSAVLAQWIEGVYARGQDIRWGHLQVHGTWRDHGVANPEDLEFDEPVRISSIDENSVTFSCDEPHVSYWEMDAVDPLQDDFGQGEQPTHFWWYCDDSCSEGSDELDFPVDFDRWDFEDWIEDHYPNEFSKVGDEGTENGCGWSWYYYTFNPQRKMSWMQGVINEFAKQEGLEFDE